MFEGPGHFAQGMARRIGPDEVWKMDTYPNTKGSRVSLPRRRLNGVLTDTESVQTRMLRTASSQERASTQLQLPLLLGGTEQFGPHSVPVPHP